MKSLPNYTRKTEWFPKMGKKNGQFKAKLGILNVEKKFYLTLAKKKKETIFLMLEITWMKRLS